MILKYTTILTLQCGLLKNETSIKMNHLKMHTPKPLKNRQIKIFKRHVNCLGYSS